MNIPTTIFQTWKSKTDIPENFAHWSKTFRDTNPNYVYKLWDDADNRAFIAECYPWFLPTYDAFPAEIYRADAVRYFFLYHFGGVYADMDTECLQPLDSLLEAKGVLFGRMGTNEFLEHSIPNAIMMSRPREEFWLLMMSLMMSAEPNQRPEYTTGPVVLKRAVELYSNDYREDVVQNRLAEVRWRIDDAFAPSTERSYITLLPGHALFPLDWTDQVHEAFVRRPLAKEKSVIARSEALALFPRSFTVTYWSHSWEEQNL